MIHVFEPSEEVRLVFGAYIGRKDVLRCKLDGVLGLKRLVRAELALGLSLDLHR